MLSVAGKSKDEMIKKLGLVDEDLRVIQSIVENKNTPCVTKLKDKNLELFETPHEIKGKSVDRKEIHDFRNEIWNTKNPNPVRVGKSTINMKDIMLEYDEIEEFRNKNIFEKKGNSQPLHAIITVGPPGCGKSFTLGLNNNPALPSKLTARTALTEDPVLKEGYEYVTINPDDMFDMCYKKLRAKYPGDNDVDVQLALNIHGRNDYINMLNHENFLLALQQKKNILFDGTGKDPTNTCGRVLRRLKQFGYAVTICFVLCDLNTSIQQDAGRERQVGESQIQGIRDFMVQKESIHKYMTSSWLDINTDKVRFFVRTLEDPGDGKPVRTTKEIPKDRATKLYETTTSDQRELLRLLKMAPHEQELLALM